jgi:hypothetical protein
MKCQKCGGQLLRILVANLVDYRHKGQCSAPEVVGVRDLWEPAARRYRDIEKVE